MLVIGYGNPGRLDDGLGPAFAAAVEQLGVPGVAVDADYQLSVEDAAAIATHDVVIFADAAVTGAEPFSFTRITPKHALSFSTHSIEPEAVLALANGVFGATARGYALGIRGYLFNEFGEAISKDAQRNLAAAVSALEPVLRARTFEELASRFEVGSNAVAMRTGGE
ncbi:MAG: hydrogenase maturation protease [Acidobacteria bacterium]|nr:hydrogenase maturation protease [Acidobacteriota bacterium]